MRCHFDPRPLKHLLVHRADPGDRQGNCVGVPGQMQTDLLACRNAQPIGIAFDERLDA